MTAPQTPNLLKLPLDPALVERFTGQRQIDTVASAQAEMDAAQIAYTSAITRHRDRSIHLYLTELKSLWKRFRVWAAHVPRRLGVPAWTVMLAFCSLAALTQALIIIGISGAELSLVLLTSLAPFLGMGFIPILFPGDASGLIHSAARAREEFVSLQSRYAAHRSEIETARRRLAEAQRIHRGLVEAENSLQA